jgi:hypothetical protein
MSPEPAPEAGNTPPADPARPPARKLAAAYAPKLAVLAVAGAAVAAAFMGTRPDSPAQESAAAPPPPRQAVVRAPPLVVEAPPLRKLPAADRVSPPESRAAHAMGAAPACERCGVVESVAAATPGQSFQMRIRMDDGSMRTLEQRGALAAGTRVVVDGGSVRLMPS